MDLLPMFLLLFTTGTAVTGLTGYLIFGPLSYVQARDRGIRLGAHCFTPDFLKWIVAGSFRSTQDRAITGLATPAQLLAWCFIVGTLGSGVLLLPYL
ncbi:MAG: hypothetical protein KDJ14_09625 [Xanthomonadales bacterium]|nr:hypothetical protein [Xanthomonadales bacterium]